MNNNLSISEARKKFAKGAKERKVKEDLRNSKIANLEAVRKKIENTIASKVYGLIDKITGRIRVRWSSALSTSPHKGDILLINGNNEVSQWLDMRYEGGQFAVVLNENVREGYIDAALLKVTDLRDYFANVDLGAKNKFPRFVDSLTMNSKYAFDDRMTILMSIFCDLAEALDIDIKYKKGAIRLNNPFVDSEIIIYFRDIMEIMKKGV